MQIQFMKMNLVVFIFVFRGFIVTIFSVKTPEKQDIFPSNWKDYIDPLMLKKYQGKSQLGFSDEDYFQGDIRGVDKSIPIEDLKKGLNNAIANKDKRWPGEKLPDT